MGFSIDVTLSAKIPVKGSELISAVLALSPLFEYDHPEKGRVIGFSPDHSDDVESCDNYWSQDDIINDWLEQDILSHDKGRDWLVVAKIGRDFYKGGGAEQLYPRELDLSSYKKSLISFLRKLIQGQYSGPESLELSQGFLKVPSSVLASPFPSLAPLESALPEHPLPPSAMPWAGPNRKDESSKDESSKDEPTKDEPIKDEQGLELDQANPYPRLPKDESDLTKAKAKDYFETLIQAVEQINVWTMTVEMC